VEDQGPRTPCLRCRSLRDIKAGNSPDHSRRNDAPERFQATALRHPPSSISSGTKCPKSIARVGHREASHGGYQSIPGDLEYLSPQPVRSQCGFVLVSSMKRRIEVAGIVQPFS